MFNDNNISSFEEQLTRIINSGIAQISNIKPSEWTELNVVMEEPFPGLYSYELTPYWREVIDRFAVDDPMLWIAIMKGAQIGFSAGVLIPVLLWSIVNDPCRIYFMVGSPDLVEKATGKLDKGIDGAGIRHYIADQTKRKRAQKSGDTNFKKDFAGGFIQIDNPNNHANLRDVSLRKGLFDDFESMKRASKQSGSTRKMLEQRFAAYEGRHKICYGSTPELKETSNIEEAYELGDCRKYLTPCPCCGEFIEWKWSITVGDITGGIVWDMKDGKFVKGSVKYKCQMCGDTYNDKQKQKLLNQGYWQPTKEPSKPGYFSYHISALYAPLGMYDWEHYVYDYLEAHPGGVRDEALYKTFVNVVLGETYAATGEEPDARTIQKNKRDYLVGTVPEKLSMAHGNGRIVLLTCGADLNGKMKGYNSDENDARLDYEILAHCENGATYSITHGSIGTFIPRQGTKVTDRVHWTYEHNMLNSVWPEFEIITGQTFKTDTGREMSIGLTCVDVGVYATNGVYPFLDKTNNNVVGVKGEKEDKYILYKANTETNSTEGDKQDRQVFASKDAKIFKQGLERTDIYILQVGIIKDRISMYMGLHWDEAGPQPPFFMNYPYSRDGLYELENFFEHYEAEHRTLVKNKDGNNEFRWVKKGTSLQNHNFDNRVYNLAAKDIFLSRLAAMWKVPKLTWEEYVAAAVAEIMRWQANNG